MKSFASTGLALFVSNAFDSLHRSGTLLCSTTEHCSDILASLQFQPDSHNSDNASNCMCAVGANDHKLMKIAAVLQALCTSRAVAAGHSS